MNQLYCLQTATSYNIFKCVCMQMFCSCAVSLWPFRFGGGSGGGTPPGGPLGSRNYVHEIRQASFVVESPLPKVITDRQTDTMEEIPTSP